MEDIYCANRDVLLAPSHNNAKVGSRVEFIAQNTAKGLNAVKVTAIGGGHCCGGRSKGTVRRFDGFEGTGYIEADDGSGEFHFVSRDIWKPSGIVHVNEKVEFDPMQGTKSWYATYITSVGGKVIPQGKGRMAKTCTAQNALFGQSKKFNDTRTASPNGRKLNAHEAYSPPTNLYDGSTTGRVNGHFGDDSPQSKSPPLGSHQLSGVVVSWKHESDFGFIQRDDGAGDVFVHRNRVLLNEGDLNPKVGSKVIFEFQANDRNGKAINVTAVGGGPCEGGRSKGTVQFWIDNTNFGVIIGEDGSELRLSLNDVWDSSQTFNKGDVVEYDPFRYDRQKLYARYVTLEGGQIEARDGSGTSPSRRIDDVTQSHFEPNCATLESNNVDERATPRRSNREMYGPSVSNGKHANSIKESYKSTETQSANWNGDKKCDRLASAPSSNPFTNPTPTPRAGKLIGTIVCII